MRTAEFTGSAWRGAFGHALKKVACCVSGQSCDCCPKLHDCPYPYIFETRPSPDASKMRLYKTAPHPYILIPSTDSLADNHGENRQPCLGVTLVGNANGHLPLIMRALAISALGGIHGQPCYFRSAEQEVSPGNGNWVEIGLNGSGARPTTPYTIPPPPSRNSSVTVTLHTPLRLQREGKLVNSRDFRFSDLFANLLRRVSMLMTFHEGQNLEADFSALTQAARNFPLVSQNLQWRDWARFSSRQRTKVDMGGLVGEFSVNASELADFWPYLWLGQWVHAGKGTVMGLGRYTMQNDNLAEIR